MGFKIDTDNAETKRELEAFTENGRLPHSIVILSQSREKRETTALYIAKWAVCTSEKNKPCGICSGCIKAEASNHCDIYFAKKDGKKQLIPIEEIKHIASDSYVIPNEANAKVYIFFDGGSMLEKAQNALLKTLEEPPQNNYYIITADSAEGLLGTVLSRCTVFKLDSTVNERTDFPEKIIAAADNACTYVSKKNEWALLLALSAVQNPDEAMSLLEIIESRIQAAISLKSGISSSENEAIIALSAVSYDSILKIKDTIEASREALNRNINIKLFVNCLCSELRACI